MCESPARRRVGPSPPQPEQKRRVRVWIENGVVHGERELHSSHRGREQRLSRCLLLHVCAQATARQPLQRDWRQRPVRHGRGARRRRFARLLRVHTASKASVGVQSEHAAGSGRIGVESSSSALYLRLAVLCRARRLRGRRVFGRSLRRTLAALGGASASCTEQGRFREYGVSSESTCAWAYTWECTLEDRVPSTEFRSSHLRRRRRALPVASSSAPPHPTPPSSAGPSAPAPPPAACRARLAACRAPARPGRGEEHAKSGQPSSNGVSSQPQKARV